MKKRLISFLCVVMFFASLTGVQVSFPDSVVMYKDKEWENGKFIKLEATDNSIEVTNKAIVPRKLGDYAASASIFGVPYKKVKLTVLEEKEVILGGQTVGIRLYSDGLVVVGVGRVSENEKSPAEKAGIEIGDVIKEINGQKVGSPDNFTKIIEASQGEITLLVKKKEGEELVKLTPSLSEFDKLKRIGLWVRDSTAGVGTLTYMCPDTLSYGALGHGISDSDTSVRFEVLKGSIEECSVKCVVKGEKGNPGEIVGAFNTGAPVIGNIEKNEAVGIFGQLKKEPSGERVKTAPSNEIKKGEAYIRTSLKNGEIKDYKIEITRVSPKSKNPLKGLVISITDEELIEKTGGIVQGMSGSPIIQNGRLVGAVTHVLVNDPTKGYGVCIENMLREE